MHDASKRVRKATSDDADVQNRLQQEASAATASQVHGQLAYRKCRDSDGKETPDELMELLVAVNSIPIASAECERGFSQMNLICTPNRASLLTSTISSLLFLNLVGPPLDKFNPVPYVRSWVAKGHRTAPDP